MKELELKDGEPLPSDHVDFDAMSGRQQVWIIFIYLLVILLAATMLVAMYILL